MIKGNNLQIHSSQWQYIFDWEGGHIPISHLINDISIFRYSKKSLWDKQIMFIDQIFDKYNNRLLNWYQINKLSHLPPRGKTLLWYKYCKKILREFRYTTINMILRTEWYTNMLGIFDYKCLKRDTFIILFEENNIASTVIFEESVKKKWSNDNGIIKIRARHMILKNVNTLIRHQGCNIN